MARLGRSGIVAACFVLSALLGPIWHAFPVLLLDLERAFGGSRTDVALAFSAFALAHAFSTPLIGQALARFDSRLVMSGLSLVLAAGLCLASQATSLSQFYLSFGLVAGIGTQAFGSYFVFSLIANRVRRRPGTAMALADAGAGAGVFVGLPLVSRINEAADWRAAFLALAVAAAVAGPAAHLLLPRLERVDRRGPATTAWTPQAIRTSALAVASLFLGSVVLQSLQTYQVVAFTALGATRSAAAWTVGVAGLAVFTARLAAGPAIDAWGPGRTMAIAAGGAALAFLSAALFAGSRSDHFLLLYALGFAIGFGSQGIIYASQQRISLDPEKFLAASSVLRVGAGLGLFAGPIAGSFSYNLFGGYAGFFLAMLAVAACHFGLFFVTAWLGRRRAK